MRRRWPGAERARLLTTLADLDRQAGLLHRRLQRQQRLVSWRLGPALRSELVKLAPFDLVFEPHELQRLIELVEQRQTTDLKQLLIHPGPTKLEIKRWLEVARRYTLRKGFVTALLPAKPCEAWWRDLVLPYAEHVTFVTGRLQLSNPSHTGRPGHPGHGHALVGLQSEPRTPDVELVVRWVTLIKDRR